MAVMSKISACQAGAPSAPSGLLSPTGCTKHRNKAALLIGCRYKGNEHHFELNQTHDDVRKVKNLLIKKYHYAEANIKVLLDDGAHEAPTKANIERQMRKLVADAKSGDCLFLHFSGHGAQTECDPDDNTELDGMDEAIVPCDATDDKDTWIIDNDMNKLLVRKIPVNAQLIAFFDMCHSGTALDLKHYYNEDGTVCSGHNASDCHPPERAQSRRGSFEQGAIHVCKRTSHDTVERESCRLNELPSSAATTPLTSHADKTTRRRRFSYMKRKGTVHCELSEGMGISLLTKSADYNAEPTVTQRSNSCADCGGLLDEQGAARDCDQAQAQCTSMSQGQQGFIPPRPAPRRRTRIYVTGGEQRAQITRRNSDLSPREKRYGCFSVLQLIWLPPLLRLKFGIADQGAGGEKVRKDNARSPPTRASTETSLTHLLSSSPTSTSPIHCPVNVAASSFKALPGRRSTPVVTALALDAIREDGPVSRFSVSGDVIPRCMSPQGLWNPNAEPEAKPDHSSRVEHQTKCRCRTSSGPKSHGQVISIGASNDEELSWETSRGSLTSALVEILEKDAHPTFSSLASSIQAVLNKLSDDMRRSIDWNKKHVRFMQSKAKRERRAKKARSAAASRRTSTKSRKSGDDIGTDMIDVVEDTVRSACGGPVQKVMIGSERFMDLNKTAFSP